MSQQTALSQQTTLSHSDTADKIYLHQDRIYRYVLTLVGDPAEAEDLTQDALLRAYQKYDSLREPAALSSWLYRIATHVSYDRLRQRVRREPFHAEADIDKMDVPDGKAPSLQKLMEQREMSECVEGYLNGLSDSYRAVIMLHDMHGMTNPEIAEAIGISLSNVKIRLHRARVKLRGALKEVCEFSRDDRGVLTCDPRSESDTLEK